MRRSLPAALLLAMLATPSLAEERAVPYWASIAKGEAMLRAGPDRSYPALWLYRRRDLPLQVVQLHGVWRRVREQDGTTGWMLASLLARRRAGIVSGGIQAIRDQPDPAARLMWQAEPGVVGRLESCDGRWCRIRIGAREGYILQGGLWGVAPGEAFDG